MKRRLHVITALVKKDLRGLLPLVLLVASANILGPIIASLELESQLEFWAVLQENFYWLSYFLSLLLMVSVIQQDPASSINHDWLTRPIPRLDLLLAKFSFLVLTVCAPLLLSRLYVFVDDGFSFGEALANALAIENLPAVLPVPFLFAVALLTSTLKKAITWSVAVIFVLILPAWNLTQPVLALIGIDFRDFNENLAWLKAIPLALIGLSAVMAVYVFAYGRREYQRARNALAVITVFALFAIYPPHWLHDTDDGIALLAELVNRSDAQHEDSLVLEHTYACFPGFKVGTSPDTEQARTAFVGANWQDEDLARAGAGAVAFQTRVRSRRMPTEWFATSLREKEVAIDWRVHRIRVRSGYETEPGGTVLPIPHSRTAENRFSPLAPVRAGYWLIPAKLARLDQPVRLVMDYDLALLSPTVYELAVDGLRRHLPEVGYCSATRKTALNNISVKCSKRGAQSALVSAELIGVPASRVDNRPIPNYTADWLQSLGRTEYELSIGAPNLVNSSSVLVMAWEVERIFRKQLVSAGWLGAPSEICPPPSEQRFAAGEKSSWSDRSPHEVNVIAVEPGVRLEVLDWRAPHQLEPDASLPTLVLIPGLGATAHSFDNLAQKLAQHYAVVGITRRGTGDSSKPLHGYSPARLSQDILQVLDTLGIEKPILVGHSVAGEELSYLGAHHANRVSGLIYLDAAFDRSKTQKELRKLDRSLPPRPPPRPREFISYEASHDYMKRIGAAHHLPEGEIIASHDFATGTNKHVSRYLEAIEAGIKRPAYEQITVPALAIYAIPSSPASLMKPWYEQDDPQTRATVERIFELTRQVRLESMHRFDREVADSQVIAIEDANHWIFLSNEEETIRAIDDFITGRKSGVLQIRDDPLQLGVRE